MLEFFVKDTGVGISKDQSELIFERFRQGSISFTRAYEGAGLGLSISKALVQMLGGEIWVHSMPGKGSEFFFRIPFVKQNEWSANKVIEQGFPFGSYPDCRR